MIMSKGVATSAYAQLKANRSMLRGPSFLKKGERFMKATINNTTWRKADPLKLAKYVEHLKEEQAADRTRYRQAHLVFTVLAVGFIAILLIVIL